MFSVDLFKMSRKRGTVILPNIQTDKKTCKLGYKFLKSHNKAGFNYRMFINKRFSTSKNAQLYFGQAQGMFAKS